MGKAILYCYKCSSLLREDDFAKGKAVRVGDNVACAGCTPEAPAPPPPPLSKKNITSSRIPAVGPGSSASIHRPPPPAPRGNPKLLFAAAAGAAVVVLIAIVALSSGGPAPAEKTSGPAPAPPPVAAPTDAPDRKALEAARRWAQEHPQDLSGQIREFQSVVLSFERSPSAPAAQKEIERIKTEIRGQVDAAMAKLERDLQDFLDRKDYESALRIVAAAASRLPHTEWELARAKRESEIFELQRSRPKPVVEDKKPPPAPPPPPPPNVPSKELQAWTARWTPAMHRAGARDHAAAAADLVQAAAALQDEGIRLDAAQDAADLKAIQSFLAASIDWASKRPAGSSLSLQLRDGRALAGRVVQAGAERVELDSGFAEWSELSAPSIAALPRRDLPEPRLLAIFCLLEGEVEAAKSILGGATAAVPDRFWTHAEGAKAKLPRTPAAELAARELFYAAEREFRSMATRGPASEKYARLKGEFAATELVRRAGDRIPKRAEACRDYFLPASGFAYGGTFKPTREGRLESKADSDPNATLQNFAETEFYALPSTAYRCWILAGGCCQENFAFLWQGTDLKEKKLAIEPGTGNAMPVKVAIKGLKATNTPKSAARWEWIEIPLPRYPAPGLKKARFVTSQQGFGIACAVVSSTRTKPPADAELQELQKAQPPKPVDPDLVAHYSFDELNGDEVADASGNGHTGKVVGAVAWTPAQVGKGLLCDGAGGHVLLPSAPLLDKLQTESHSIVAWYRPEVVPPGPDEANDSGHGIVIKRGWHQGILFTREGTFMAEHWILDGKGTAGAWGETFATGKFHHVAVVVDRPAGKTIVYVNGRHKNTREWPPGTATRDYQQEPWRIGIGAPHAQKWAWPAKGIIDDVRMYKRALTADEIQTLYDLQR